MSSACQHDTPAFASVILSRSFTVRLLLGAITPIFSLLSLLDLARTSSDNRPHARRRSISPYFSTFLKTTSSQAQFLTIIAVPTVMDPSYATSTQTTERINRLNQQTDAMTASATGQQQSTAYSEIGWAAPVERFKQETEDEGANVVYARAANTTAAAAAGQAT
ncbi:hypothetical protein FN846DRAFT_923874 [Sphaerosporella brunnea]|uniref:Uncharacterized protein n=1 Tax=Sphaerosporella brunnea TaxID=1250544 RepID=A0A5J5EDM2_9PEZI|nr:hypothetical protein FN846DRAFT_923874 [Sphaerosporella brunnea]